jgi:hypothetical protein
MPAVLVAQGASGQRRPRGNSDGIQMNRNDGHSRHPRAFIEREVEDGSSGHWLGGAPRQQTCGLAT